MHQEGEERALGRRSLRGCPAPRRRRRICDFVRALGGDSDLRRAVRGRGGGETNDLGEDTLDVVERTTDRGGLRMRERGGDLALREGKLPTEGRTDERSDLRDGEFGFGEEVAQFRERTLCAVG